MVDSIGSRPVSANDRIAGVSRVQTPSVAVPIGRQPGRPPAPTVAARLAASPPVDTDHVERIKQALAEGNFPLSPATIADRLIAARYEWMADDQA